MDSGVQKISLTADSRLRGNDNEDGEDHFLTLRLESRPVVPALNTDQLWKKRYEMAILYALECPRNMDMIGD